jgi:hypothetical protein
MAHLLEPGDLEDLILDFLGKVQQVSVMYVLVSRLAFVCTLNDSNPCHLTQLTLGDTHYSMCIRKDITAFTILTVGKFICGNLKRVSRSKVSSNIECDKQIILAIRTAQSPIYHAAISYIASQISKH